MMRTPSDSGAQMRGSKGGYAWGWVCLGVGMLGSAVPGPFDVMPVDDQRVLMTDRRMPVGMGVRLRPLPTLVGMLMVFVMDMEVIVPESHMDMLDLAGIAGRPQPARQYRRRDSQPAQHREGGA